MSWFEDKEQQAAAMFGEKRKQSVVLFLLGMSDGEQSVLVLRVKRGKVRIVCEVHDQMWSHGIFGF